MADPIYSATAPGSGLCSQWTFGTLRSNPDEKLQPMQIGSAAAESKWVKAPLASFGAASTGVKVAIVTGVLVVLGLAIGLPVGLAVAGSSSSDAASTSNAFMTPKAVKLASDRRRLSEAFENVEFTCTNSDDAAKYSFGYMGIYAYMGDTNFYPAGPFIYDWKLANAVGAKTYAFDSALLIHNNVAKNDSVAMSTAPINSVDDIKTRVAKFNEWKGMNADDLMMGCIDLAEYRDGVNGTGAYTCGPRFISIFVLGAESSYNTYTFEIYSEVQKFLKTGKAEGTLVLEADIQDKDGPTSCKIVAPITITNATGTAVDTPELFTGIAKLSVPSTGGVGEGMAQSQDWKLDTRFPSHGWTWEAAPGNRWQNDNFVQYMETRVDGTDSLYKAHFKAQIDAGTMSDTDKLAYKASIDSGYGQSASNKTSADDALFKMYIESFGPKVGTFCQHYLAYSLKQSIASYPNVVKPSNVNDKMWNYAKGLGSSPNSF